jgi:carbonic anhydrase
MSCSPRQFTRPILWLLAAIASSAAPAATRGEDHQSATPPPAPRSPAHAPGAGLSPDLALARLIEGNARFAAGRAEHPNCDAARRADCAANGQQPFATVLTCSDSRLVAERIFDQGIGDVFVVRVAGNVADTDEIGTLEYGVGHLHTPLLVVMGHTACGAVQAACSGAKLDGALPRLIDNILPAVAAARTADPARTGDALVAATVEANVFQSLADTLRRSPEVRTLIAAGRVQAVGAVYDLESGRVRWLGPHPDQSRLLTQLELQTATAAAAPAGHAVAIPPTDDAHDARPTAVAGVTAERPTAQPAASDHAAPAATHAPDAPPLPTAGEALQQLRDGHARFLAGRSSHARCDTGWLARTARGQHPFVTVLACSDSRVPVERIFDKGVGDLFVVRVAGNVADIDEIASMEYAAVHLHTPLLLVLGHTSCGAVTAVAENAQLGGCIPELVDNVAPAVARARAWNAALAGPALISAAIRTNVQQSIQDVQLRSAVIRELVTSGKLMIVGGVYDLSTGMIEWLDDPTRQASASNSTVAPRPRKAPDPH